MTSAITDLDLTALSAPERLMLAEHGELRFRKIGDAATNDDRFHGGP